MAVAGGGGRGGGGGGGGSSESLSAATPYARGMWMCPVCYLITEKQT